VFLFEVQAVHERGNFEIREVCNWEDKAMPLRFATLHLRQVWTACGAYKKKASRSLRTAGPHFSVLWLTQLLRSRNKINGLARNRAGEAGVAPNLPLPPYCGVPPE
jgi:hypothetical protein